MATAMGAKHRTGRLLTLADFLPEKAPVQTAPAVTHTPWQDQLALIKDLMKPKGGYEETERGTLVKPD